MRALVLSGGGVKGAYQVGALQKWIGEDGLDYDIFCGVSVGSINAAFLTQFPSGDPKNSFKKLEEVWAKVTQKNVKKSWCPFGVLESAWKPSVYNSTPLQEWIRSELDSKAVAASGKKLRVVSVSWNTGKVHVATEADPEIANRVIASSAFPVMLLPVEIDGEMWTDGGIRNVTPLGEAIRLGADEIDIIMCSNPDLFEPFDPSKESAIPGFMLRGLDILSAQVEVADLKICGLKNDLAELRPEYRKVKFRLLQPNEILVKDSLDFDPEAIKRMMAKGYADACALPPG